MNHPQKVGAEGKGSGCPPFLSVRSSVCPERGCGAVGPWGCGAALQKRPLCSKSASILSPGRGQLLCGEIAGDRTVLFPSSYPPSCGSCSQQSELWMWAACDVWHSCRRAFGKKQYWVRVRGGRAQGDRRERWGGREAQAGRETGRGWGLSLPPRSPLISRPRIEPPINKSKSYLNTLPPPLGLWVSGIRLHLSAS